MIHVVTGPPCAGKTTFARKHMGDGDVLVDLDAIAVALGSPDAHRHPPNVFKAALAARQAVIEAVGGHDAWVIHTRPTEAQRLDYGAAAFHDLDPGMETCLSRARADGRPQGTERAIREWYEATRGPEAGPSQIRTKPATGTRRAATARERRREMPNQSNAQDGAPETGERDYKALWEASQAEAEKWKALSKKNEGRAKSNAEAAKGYEDATAQLAELTQRLDALEGENATLKAQAARSQLVAKVSQATDVPEAVVALLAATDEDALTQAATAIAEAYKPQGGAPPAPEAGNVLGGTGTAADADWLRDALSSR